jgi:hypothetical protein
MRGDSPAAMRSKRVYPTDAAAPDSGSKESEHHRVVMLA